MSELWGAVLRRAALAAPVILVAALTRVLLRRGPKGLRCLFWALAAVTLVTPWRPAAPFSAYNLLPAGEGAALTETLPGGGTQPADAGAARERETAPGVWDAAARLWLLGVGTMLLAGAADYGRLRRRVRAALPAGEGVYICDELPTPCILGVLRPRVCLPSGLEEGQRAAVLLHERAHLRRGDHLWKLVGFLLLAVYWFSPFSWLGYALFCRDVELACDERAVRGLTASARIDYAQALLDTGLGRRQVFFCPPAFGGTAVEARVREVLRPRRASPVAAALMLLLAAGTALTLLTAPAKGAGTEPVYPESPAPETAAETENIGAIAAGRPEEAHGDAAAEGPRATEPGSEPVTEPKAAPAPAESDAAAMPAAAPEEGRSAAPGLYGEDFRSDVNSMVVVVDLDSLEG